MTVPREIRRKAGRDRERLLQDEELECFACHNPKPAIELIETVPIGGTRPVKVCSDCMVEDSK